MKFKNIENYELVHIKWGKIKILLVNILYASNVHRKLYIYTYC